MKKYDIDDLKNRTAQEIMDLAESHGIDIANKGIFSLLEELADIDVEPEIEVVDLTVRTSVSSQTGVVFSCGGNHVTAAASSSLVGKTLGQALESLREVLNIPNERQGRVVFLNGLVERNMNTILCAGDVVDVTTPAGAKG